MVAGDKRRSAEHLEVKTLDYFINICSLAENTRDSCLIALLFLSGRRISELIGLKKQDIIFTQDYMTVTTFNLKAFLSQASKEFTIPRQGRYYSKIAIDISKSAEAYRALGEFVEAHLATLKPNDYVFERQRGEGHIGATMAYKIVTFLAPETWPHWYRHQRFTQVYNTIKTKVKDPFDVVKALHDFSKHRRIDTTLNYIHHLKLQEIKKEI